MKYDMPSGYQTSALALGSQAYKPNNGYVNGDQTSPSTPTVQVKTLTFSAAPADGSQITDVPDGYPGAPTTPAVDFTFVYAGSPGPGTIPLVAGGGTAAQAAAAAAVAMGSQLTNWIVTNPTAGVLVLTQRNPGLNPSPTLGLSGNTHITIETVEAETGSGVVPGRFGKNYCFLPVAVPIPVPN